MLFSSKEYIILALVVIAFLRLVRNKRIRKLFLLAVSYYFYAYWDWRFLSLILFSTFVDYFVGQRLKNCENMARRRLFLIISLVTNLGLLGCFKYFNFFIESMNIALAPLRLNLGTLNIILPIGISFYTFQTLSYTIDVYRRQLEPCNDFWDFALFVSFFPQLVAGPIVRAKVFLPQLDTPRQLSWDRTFLGIRQFVIGLFKKVLVADCLAFYVDNVFANTGAYDCLTTWLVLVTYSLQIYCDFSGYSDMAIGMARIMGFDFPENFRLPYIAKSISDFWRRWHISLSSWLRDYLYISLGGNRGGRLKTYRNLLLTMLLGGLWHGESWTFVFWGGFHGVSLVIAKLVSRENKESGPSGNAARIVTGLSGWIVTMLIVCIGWVFFRSQTFTEAILMLRQMFVPNQGIAWYNPFAICAIVAFAITHAISAMGMQRLLELPVKAWRTPVVLCTMALLTGVFRPAGFHPFIYFQF